MSAWSDRMMRRLAWCGWWTVLLVAALRAVTLWDQWRRAGTRSGADLVSDYAFVLVIVVFPLVGLVILVRQPRNRVAWLLEGVGLVWCISWLLDAYAWYGLAIDPGSLPGAGVAAAVNEGMWTWGILVMGFYLVLLFPDGRLPTPRWRWLAWLAPSAAFVIHVVVAVSPGELAEGPVNGMQNPIGVESLEVPLLVVLAVLLPVYPISVVGAAASLVLRFRRSHGIEREQVKWLATAGAMVALCYLATLVSTLATELAAAGTTSYVTPAWVRLLETTSVLTFLLLPIAIGAAVLRYRLYDIDVVINRALVYGSLTAALAGLYLGSVLLLQLVLRPAQAESDLAVALSTLVVAAVFRPARSRIQASVDRRFYRHKYDAGRTLEAFSGRLRHQVDLDAVGAELLAACRETVQPTQVSIWLSAGRQR